MFRQMIQQLPNQTDQIQHLKFLLSVLNCLWEYLKII